jgi:hypothetical protein
MSEWTELQLERIGAAEELEVAFIVVWVVRVDSDLYVRSFHGTVGGWYRRVQQSRRARIRAGGLEHDVTFRAAQPADTPAITRAYRTKYALSPYMEAMVGPDASSATLQVVAI